MVEQLLGTATTDENGIATFTLTGSGRGKLNIVAKSGSLTSEPHIVWDYLFADYINGGKNKNFTRTNVEVGFDSGIVWVHGKNNGTYISNQVISGDFEALIECKQHEGGEVRIGFFNATSSPSKSVRISISHTDYRLWKIRRENGVWSVQYSSDNGETWIVRSSLDQSTLTTEDCYFGVYVLHTSEDLGVVDRILRYKNLKIYNI